MKRLIYGVAGVAVLIVAGLLISRALNDSLVYFVLPNEVARDPGEYSDRRLRLGGIVEEGTIHFDDESLQLTFLVTDTVQSYTVAHTGTPPELFKENGGVVIEGSFEGDLFVSDTLLVKHSEVYEAPKDGQPVDLEALKETLE
jgi:cytochrome c-type biogenesis protein CcmE